MEKYTVSEFTEIISEIIDEAVPVAWIEGEVSRFKKYPSGHCYFTIKDENSSISAVIWSTYANKFEKLPREGEKALFFGKTKVFEKRGQYQFSIFNYNAIGQGDINQNFELLKKRLSKEGLFDITKKRPIKKIPERVAIITGKDSAALSDVLKVFKSRSPFIDVKLFYSPVQGEKNDVKVIEALKQIENYSKKTKKIDTVLLVRGGGSIEDLWLFNSEKLVRFISKFSIPLISGVGHDIDYTLVDFISDLRAPTPSVAAEKCAIDIENIWQTTDYFDNKIKIRIEDKILSLKNSINMFNEKFKTHILDFKIAEIKNRLNINISKLENSMDKIVKQYKNRYNLVEQKIENLNPDHIFQLGFASVKWAENGNLISSIKNIKINSDIKVILRDGEFFAKITNIKRR